MSDIRRVMSTQAVRAWNRALDSARLDFSTGEETLTDVLLLDTHKADPTHFRMRKHTRSEESDSGADWEAWVFAISSDLALPVRVQAKRMYLHGVFRYLDDTQQVEKLIRNAEHERALPLVALFCYRKPTHPVAWCCLRRLPQHFGCTIVPAQVVLSRMKEPGRLGKLQIDEFADVARSWRCMGCRRYVERVTREHPAQLRTADNMPDYARALLGFDTLEVRHDGSQQSVARLRLRPPRVVIVNATDT